MEKLKDYLLKRVSHIAKRINPIEDLHSNNPIENYSYHGGRNLGLLQGRLAAYQDILDRIEEIEEIEEKNNS